MMGKYKKRIKVVNDFDLHKKERQFINKLEEFFESRKSGIEPENIYETKVKYGFDKSRYLEIIIDIENNDELNDIILNIDDYLETFNDYKIDLEINTYNKIIEEEKYEIVQEYKPWYDELKDLLEKYNEDINEYKTIYVPLYKDDNDEWVGKTIENNLVYLGLNKVITVEPILGNHRVKFTINIPISIYINNNEDEVYNIIIRFFEEIGIYNYIT